MKDVRTGLLVAMLVALFGGLGFWAAGPRGALLALAVAAVTNVVAWWNADRLVLRLHGAREVTADRCPELVGLVRDLADRIDLPTPRVYVIDNPHPNAFATGRDPAHAAVAATTGLLARLDRDEIEAVMAHELGHVAARDTLTMTLVATLSGAIATLASFGTLGRRANPLALLVAIVAAPLAATLLRLAIGRQREYRADAIAAHLSGKPRALASALAKLSGAGVADPVSAARPALAALYIVAPPLGGLAGLFSTHPAPAARIAALEALARDLDPPARRSALSPRGR